MQNENIHTSSAIVDPSGVLRDTPPAATSEILELLPKESPSVQPHASAGTLKTPDAPSGASLPFPELSGLGFEWLPTTDEKIVRKRDPLFIEHTKLLSNGTKVEDIQHPSKFAVWACGKGCQCAKCKTSRVERRDKSSAQSSNPDSSKVISPKITEKLFGNLLDLPNKGFKLFAVSKHYPKEAIEVWNTPQEELEMWGQYGKYLTEHYLNMSDFKHKELSIFLLTYLGSLGTRYGMMVEFAKNQEAKK